MTKLGAQHWASAALILFVGNTNAFWRLECDGSVGLARLDPLMNPGGVSDHVHSIKGGSAFTSSSTAEDLLKSKCQSCGVKQDKSAYWHPPLYFFGDDGTIEIVPEKPPFKAYYELNTGSTADGKPQTIEAFPNGFQMIAGNNYNRNWSLSGPDPDTFTGPWNDDTNEQREQRATGFNCMNYGHNGAAAKNEPTLYRHHLPEKSWLDSNCPDGLRMELQFPSCWNGEMDGGKKHKSHVAYPNWINGGDCPKGFDKRLPSLMYETIVATDKFIGKSGKFVISNGDPTGYGYHGDFISAWDDGVLEQAVKQCTDMSGEMRTCGVFEFPDNTGSCTLESPLPPSIADENCDGPMSGLPAGMKIQSGPEPATPGPGGSTGSAASGSSHEGDSSAADSVSHLAPPADDYSSGGSGPDVGAAVVDEAASDVSPPPPTTTSPPPPPTHANDPNLNIYTDGRVVHENVVVTEHVTVTQGAARVKRSPEARAEHAKRHAHRHHHAGHAVGGRRLR